MPLSEVEIGNFEIFLLLIQSEMTNTNTVVEIGQTFKDFVWLAFRCYHWAVQTTDWIVWRNEPK